MNAPEPIDLAAATPEVPSYVLTPRAFPCDYSKGFAVNWNGGSAYRSQSFNTVSLVLPAGEKWIIDTVRQVMDEMPPPLRQAWKGLARDFIAQESIHRAVHRQYNEQLAIQGVPNWIEERSNGRTVWGQRRSKLSQLASSVAYEHLTSTFAAAMLRRPQWLEGADPELARMWRWHASEEIEHKHFVLDFYRAAGGGELRRIVWYVWAVVTFMSDVQIQLALSLRATKQLWSWRTLVEGTRFNFGWGGLFWVTLTNSVRFFNPWFQPSDERGDELAKHWLEQTPPADLRP